VFSVLRLLPFYKSGRQIRTRSAITAKIAVFKRSLVYKRNCSINCESITVNYCVAIDKHAYGVNRPVRRLRRVSDVPLISLLSRHESNLVISTDARRGSSNRRRLTGRWVKPAVNHSSSPAYAHLAYYWQHVHLIGRWAKRQLSTQPWPIMLTTLVST